MDIGAAVASAIAGTTWLTYYTYHNQWGIPLVDSIGKLVSIVVFPGESDLRALTEHFTDRTREGAAHKTPCILCTATGPAVAPPPKATIDKCVSDKLRGHVITPANAYAATTKATNECTAQYTIDNGGGYNLTFESDNCTIIKGMGGFPGKAGLDPHKYIEYRMGSVELFTAGSPYQSKREQAVSDTYAGENVTFPFDLYYRVGPVSLGQRPTNEVFLPPQEGDLLQGDFIPTHDSHLEWFCPKQIGMTKEQGANFCRWLNLMFVSNPGTLTNTASPLVEFLDTIGFKAYAVAPTGIGRVVLFEWAPPPNGTGSYYPRGFASWSPDQCRTYINKYLRSTTMIPTGSQAKRTQKRATRNGLLKLK